MVGQEFFSRQRRLNSEVGRVCWKGLGGAMGRNEGRGPRMESTLEYGLRTKLVMTEE